MHGLRRSTRFDWRRPTCAVIAAGVLLLCGSISWATFLGGLESTPSANAQVAVTSGRLLGASRFQLAWLNWDAPRPVFLTALANPAVARDVAALAGQPTASVGVASPVADGRNWGVDDSDLLELDLGIAEGTRVLPRPLVMRADPRESLSWPAWWPDGTAVLFQRDDQTAPPMTSPDGFARAPARVEIAAADGTNRRALASAAWQPSPAPDGSAIAFVRFDDRGSSLVVTRSADGSKHVLVEPGRFPEIFSPRSASAAPGYGSDFSRRVEHNTVSREDTVRQIVAKIQLGEGDAAVVYVTDVTPQIADQFVEIALPDSLQVIPNYPIAPARGRNANGGQAFIDYVLSDAGQHSLAQWGFLTLPLTCPEGS